MMNIENVLKMVEELKENGVKFSAKQKNYASEWFELFELEQYVEKQDSYIIECSGSTLDNLTGRTDSFSSILLAVKVGETVIVDLPKSLDGNGFIDSLIKVENDETINEEGQHIEYIEG